MTTIGPDEARIYELEDARALLAAWRPVVRAAERRLESSHNDTCDSALIAGYPCSCGHGALADAVSGLTDEQRKAAEE